MVGRKEVVTVLEATPNMIWQVPPHRQEYLEACSEAVRSDGAFAFFRSDHRYRRVLEHVNYAQGKSYLEAALVMAPAFVRQYFKAFQQNDAVGNACCYEYSLGLICPTTLRYVYLTTELLQWAGTLDGLDIVEIGGGYGGLCRIIMATCKPHSYAIFDLESPLLLTQKYLAHYSLGDISFHLASALEKMRDVDVVISTWALSELDQQTQGDYYTHLIEDSRFGYTKYNTDYTGLTNYLKSLGRFAIVVETDPLSPKTTTVKWQEAS